MEKISQRMLHIRGFSDLRHAKWPFAPIQVPIIDWLPLYTKAELTSDLLAGINVFVLLIPQGLAFSILAGMSPVYGLYTSTIPLFIYGILGTSRQLSIGPTAITALLLGTAAQNLGYVETDSNYVGAVLNLSMLSGIILYLLGAFRLGVMSKFLSHSVITGFITASALLVSLSQLKYITGINVPRFAHTHETIIYLLVHIGDCNPYALLIGITVWIALYGVKIWKKKSKPTPEKMKRLWFKIATVLVNLSSLFAILFGSLIAYGIISSGKSIDIVGYVPAGMKAPNFKFYTFDKLMLMLPEAFIIALIAFALTWAVAKRFATLNGYEVDATQELIAQGLANIIGPLFNSFTVASGISRSAVNAESGAKTQISGCISAILVIISLECLTPVFYYIPMTVFGAIIEVSVASMIDFEEMIKAYRVDRKDCAVMVITFLFTFFIGISEGVLLGVVLSIAFVMNATAFPHIAHMGQLPQSEGGYFKDIRRFRHARQLPGIVVLGMDTSLYFANETYFKEIVREASKGVFHTSDLPVVFVIIDVSAWHDVDLSGINTLVELHTELLARNIQIGFANAKGRLRDRLKTAKFIEKLGARYIYNTIEDAVRDLPTRRRSIDIEIEAVETDYGTEERASIVVRNQSVSFSMDPPPSPQFSSRSRKNTQTGQMMFTEAYYFPLASDNYVEVEEPVIHPLHDPTFHFVNLSRDNNNNSNVDRDEGGRDNDDEENGDDDENGDGPIS